MSPLVLPMALTSASVSAIATGSLKPASASSSRTTRAPPAPARETAAKTAAGSVGESTAPSSSAGVQPKPDELVRRERDQAEGHGGSCDPEREHGRDLAAHGLEPALQTALQEHDDERDRPEDRDHVRPGRVVRAGPQLPEQQSAEQERERRRQADGARDRLERERGDGRRACDREQQREVVGAHARATRWRARG